MADCWCTERLKAESEIWDGTASSVSTEDRTRIIPKPKSRVLFPKFNMHPKTQPRMTNNNSKSFTANAGEEGKTPWDMIEIYDFDLKVSDFGMAEPAKEEEWVVKLHQTSYARISPCLTIRFTTTRANWLSSCASSFSRTELPIGSFPTIERFLLNSMAR